MTQRHVMLSYEWNVQQLAIRVYDYLVQRRVAVWMDIKAGISSDNLYDGIGTAIENAACFVCFMTPEYQQSDFCKQELQYTKQCKISIIPLKLVRDWNPSGWLGFITAGLLWLDFYHIKNFERKAVELHSRICLSIGDQLQVQSSDEEQSIEEETTYRRSLLHPPRLYSSVRIERSSEGLSVGESDVDLRHYTQGWNNPRLLPPLDAYKMKHNGPQKTFRSQNPSPSSSKTTRSNRQRASTARTPDDRYQNVPSPTRSTDDEEEEEEKEPNDCKFRR